MWLSSIFVARCRYVQIRLARVLALESALIAFSSHSFYSINQLFTHSLESHPFMRFDRKAQTGDAFNSDWHGKTGGASHMYDGVVVDNDGKALIGNKYGGKDFWDD